MITRYRFPGVKPFEVEDSPIFFGRDRDREDLSGIILLEKLVVLFGKSGYGKSSLLNAAVIPVLETKRNCKALQVRFGSSLDGQTISPKNLLVSRLEEKSKHAQDTSFLDSVCPEKTLWYYFKRSQIPSLQSSVRTKTWLLIFDQFEEYFLKPLSMRKEFEEELAQLLYTDVPQSVLDASRNCTDEQMEQLTNPLRVHVVFSIRADRLSELESMKTRLPAILHKRYELKALSKEQAEAAIMLPASLTQTQQTDVTFASPPFTWSNSAKDLLLKKLSDGQRGASEGFIEAFQLQIVCQFIENLVISTGDTEINATDLPDLARIFEEYYHQRITYLPTEKREAARRLIEDELVYENVKTGEARRISLDKDLLLQKCQNYGVNENLLHDLENTFLLRRVPNAFGGFNYEISHDTLLNPILKAKRKRQLLIQTQEIQRNAIRESRIKRRRHVSWIAFIFAILLLVSWNWETIYFRYLTMVQNDLKPTIRLENKLSGVVKQIEIQVHNDANQIGSNLDISSWTASQIVIALKGEVSDAIKDKFFRLTSNSIADTECCCWRENVNQKDLRASGWVVSSIGNLQLTSEYDCDIIKFFINNQLIDGSWSMLEIDKTLTRYGSTYATCHVLRALYNSLPNVSDNNIRREIDGSIDKGAKWVLNNMMDSAKSIWSDYPNDINFESNLSMSLSGLAIHTLNLVNYATPEINKQWLRNLKKSEASVIEIDFKERSDLFYELNDVFQGAEYHDLTRHLVIPWQIIATIDAYKDGNATEKTQANIWLNIVVDNLDAENINKNPPYVRSEVLIALRYLLDEKYVFQ